MNYSDFLTQLTVDSKDNGSVFTNDTRKKVIKQLLLHSNYEVLHEGDLSLIYRKREWQSGADSKLISSHIDSVYSQCFVETAPDGWKGTFDNSATNAALIEQMLNDQLNAQTLIAFTGDEELNAGGAKEVMHFLAEAKITPTWALILDVTNEGWDDAVCYTIENDFGFDILTGYQLVALLQEAEIPCVFVHHAEPDESWEYRKGLAEKLSAIPCLTLCLPVSGDMHADQGVLLRAGDIAPYQEVLTRLANAPF